MGKPSFPEGQAREPLVCKVRPFWPIYYPASRGGLRGWGRVRGGGEEARCLMRVLLIMHPSKLLVRGLESLRLRAARPWRRSRARGGRVLEGLRSEAPASYGLRSEGAEEGFGVVLVVGTPPFFLAAHFPAPLEVVQDARHGRP